MVKDTKSPSSKIRRGATEKRVISVPIKDVERLKLNQISSPPSDSWSWRKYGQKPIKGSPYPRGYYKCSSSNSKGCPAKKQVERSKMEPNMLLVTYSCEHNHASPVAARNNHHRATATATTTTSASVFDEDLEEEEEEEEEEEDEDEEKPINPVSGQSEEGPIVNGGEFGWLTEFESTCYTMLETPILMEDGIVTDREIGEDDESDLFADLGELPECSTVFRRSIAAEQRRCSLATTG